MCNNMEMYSLSLSLSLSLYHILIGLSSFLVNQTNENVFYVD